MASVRLVAVDLDSTFLNDQKEIPQENKEIISYLHDHGIVFGFASGRSVEAMLPVLKKWGIDDQVDFLIGVNGETIYDMKSQKREDYFLVDGQVGLDLIEFFKGMDVSGKAVYRGNRYSNESTEASRENAHMYSEEEYQVDMNEFLKDKKIMKMMFFLDPAIRESVWEKAQAFPSKEVVGTFSAPELLDFQHPSVNKGFGLEKMCEYYGFSLDETMVFGDAENDVSMIEASGLGVCMSNGQEYVKERADVITQLDNNHAGVAAFIRAYLEER